MSENYQRLHPEIYFATMHPGWADTPAVQTSMPSFRQKMINKLRTEEQGADTLVWMCCYNDLEKLERAAFFQGLNLDCLILYKIALIFKILYIF
jgi:dehydrogenase/reductase SDR family protein 12